MKKSYLLRNSIDILHRLSEQKGRIQPKLSIAQPNKPSAHQNLSVICLLKLPSKLRRIPKQQHE